MQVIQELNSFIDLAKKNRKYAENTAGGYKASIKRLAEVLNEDESVSFPLIEERFPQIMTAFYNKHQGDVSAKSLDVYKKRIKKLINDYKKWGPNLQDWAGWTILASGPRKKIEKKEPILHTENIVLPEAEKNEKSDIATADQQSDENRRYSASTRFEIPLRPGVRAFVSTPSDITKSEVKKIAKYLEYLLEISNE